MTAHCEWCPFPGCDSCAYKGWRRSEPAVIQTPDTRGPWDQRKACWCRLDQPCHADVLLELANKGAE